VNEVNEVGPYAVPFIKMYALVRLLYETATWVHVDDARATPLSAIAENEIEESSPKKNLILLSNESI
jgi:hypothetical protein